MSRTEKQASADTNVDVENSAWSLAQDERKYNRPINANVLNSNIGREHLFAACANLTNNRPAQEPFRGLKFAVFFGVFLCCI
jgi:hypothetical protein